MGKIIHILNGDSILPILEKSGIKGDVVVWRELLCEGPLVQDFASDEFWQKRQTYFETELKVETLTYLDKTIKEILKLEELSNYNEVVLWFEFDLFCQVNLLAACTYLQNNYVKTANYYLICTGKEKGKEGLQSLSNYTAEDFKILFTKKIPLSKANLMFAKDCWRLFVENDVEKLKAYNFNQCSKFEYLGMAITQHLKRFPDTNGLNQIEYKILEIINSSIFTENEIIRSILVWQSIETVYGFGDLQYFQYLKKLNKFYKIEDSKYYLNNFGKSILNFNENK